MKQNEAKQDNCIKCSQSKLSYIIFKRIFDIIASVCFVALFSPLYILIAFIICTTSKGPAIFAHKRVGKNGIAITVYKFRTMVSNAEEIKESWPDDVKQEFECNFKLNNDTRITKVGHFLRKSSLDELPQFFNVIKGNMSIVGPRPIVEDELIRYGENQKKFLSAKPGITGFWQAYARSNCTYKQRMEMELYYIDNASFWGDIKIIFATVVSVLKKRGAK